MLTRLVKIAHGSYEGQLGAGPVNTTGGWTSRLVVQDHAEKAAMDHQTAVVAVVDKAHLPELIHEMTDPRPSGAHHLGQVFLIDPGKYRFGFAFRAKMRQQQQHPSQTLLAGVEKLIDQVRFVTDVAGKQMGDEQLRDALLFVQHTLHQRFFNPDQRAIGHRGSRCDTQWLTGEVSLAN
jgi:hypothetical protein